MSQYIGAYYFSSFDMSGYPPVKRFPAVSCSYLKFSTRSALLSGQTSLPTQIAPDWDVVGLGVKLRVGAAYAIFGIPACELTNQVVNLEDIWGNTAKTLVERIASLATPAEKVRRVEEVFTGLAQRSLEKNFPTELAALEALSNSPVSPISGIAGQLGYSSRQLQRKLNDFVGLPPRLFKRISRFEKAWQLIQASARKEDFCWSDIALRCGYSDQAHFIRDFKEFTGSTPAAFAAGPEMSDPFNTCP